MQLDNEWDIEREERGFPGWGLLRPTLLFGSAAIALALMVVPMLDRDSSDEFADLEQQQMPQGLDMTSTGSIAPGGGSYTIRRSVLQDSPDAYCVIRSNGTRAGDC